MAYFYHDPHSLVGLPPPYSTHEDTLPGLEVNLTSPQHATTSRIPIPIPVPVDDSYRVETGTKSSGQVGTTQVFRGRTTFVGEVKLGDLGEEDRVTSMTLSGPRDVRLTPQLTNWRRCVGAFVEGQAC